MLAHAELVAVGQQMLVDPEWAVKLLEGRDAEFVTKPFLKHTKTCIYQVRYIIFLINAMDQPSISIERSWKNESFDCFDKCRKIRQYRASNRFVVK